MENLNFKQALDIACKYETLIGALNYIALWEIEKAKSRYVKDLNFKYIFEVLLEEYPKVQEAKIKNEIIALIQTMPGVDALFVSDNDYYIFTKDHSLIMPNDFETISNIETQFNVLMRIRAYDDETKDISFNHFSLEKVWIREGSGCK